MQTTYKMDYLAH